MMRETGFLSVCSGIEAVSEAWRDLPFQPAMYSEIEAFPRAVLEQRHNAACCRKTQRPDGSVPLWGDFTAIRIRFLLRLGVNLESIGVLIGGTPCQAFSFAGHRRGLADDRGNLTLAFVRLADAIDNFRRRRGLQPLVIAWENVEGVLSMPDNSFGCFLAGLVGTGAPLVPTGRAGWSDAGVVIGPRRAAAWRLLDAQYFGLAQRRRRVLVVASARKECPPDGLRYRSLGNSMPVRMIRWLGKRIAAVIVRANYAAEEHKPVADTFELFGEVA
jgi:DNA (cytosine-5)-methyltransferase 1